MHYCCKPTLMAVRPDWHKLYMGFYVEFMVPNTIPEEHKLSSPVLLPAPGTNTSPHGRRCRDVRAAWLELLNVGVCSSSPTQVCGSLAISAQLTVTRKEKMMLCLAKRKRGACSWKHNSRIHNLNFHELDELWSRAVLLNPQLCAPLLLFHIWLVKRHL